MNRMKPFPLPVECPKSDDFKVLVTFDACPGFDSSYIIYFVGDYDSCIECIEDLERA